MKNINEFETKNTVSTGGVTGSRRVKSSTDASYYQLKPSILDNPSKIRRLKAKSTDRENFGEVIAASISRALAGEGNIPEVSLVYDSKEKKVSVASKYLQGDLKGVRTLDEYAREIHQLPKDQKHVVCVSGNDEKTGELALDGKNMSGLKQSLANNIVLSALVGDHDVNPGNMMVVTQAGQSHIARIDFGHAFNDLLNAPQFLGGQLLDKENPMLDFFNREKVAGLSNNQSKLWRDYPGLVPSPEMVNALRNMSKNMEVQIEKGINNAKKEFTDLIDTMNQNEDWAGIRHVESSLQAISENASGKKMPITTQSTQDIVEDTFDVLHRFMLNNCGNAQRVANIMEYQLAIDDALIHGKNIPPTPDKDLLPTKEGNIQWVKNASNTPVFHGSKEDYVAHRKNELSKKNTSQLGNEDIRSITTQKIESSDNSRNTTNSFKDKLQSIQIETNIPKINPEPLINKLVQYIEERYKSEDTKSVFGVYSKTDKINAAQALILALSGHNDLQSVKQHAGALANGSLGELISSSMNMPGSKGKKVEKLLDAIEKGSIQPLDPEQSTVLTTNLSFR